MLSLTLYPLRLNKSVKCNFAIAVSGLQAYRMILLYSTYFYEKCRNSILARSSQTHAHARDSNYRHGAARGSTYGHCRPARTARHRSAVIGCARSWRPLRTRPASLWLMAQALRRRLCSLLIMYILWMD